jgi:diguanylate cyclase (GGDEF)-like protein/PAS domain S-box-containing protein
MKETTQHETTLAGQDRGRMAPRPEGVRHGPAGMRALVEHSSEAVACHDTTGRIVYCNPAWQRLMGCAPDATDRRVDEILPGHLASLHYQGALERVAASGEPLEFGFTITGGDAGRQLDVQMRVVPETDEDGNLTGLMAFGRDLTQQRKLERELLRRTAELHDLVHHSSDHIVRYDLDCRRIYVNKRSMAALGGDPGRILGKTPAEFPGGTGSGLLMQVLRDVLARGEAREFKIRWQVDGVDICHQIRMSPQFDGAGRVTHVLAVGHDVTEADRYRKEVHHQAFHDRLTGLPNRLLLCDRLSQTIADAQYHGHQFALMMLDLDHFKNVNDSLGHKLGDHLLCEVAKRLQDCVRNHDTVARLGGDEFAVLLPDVRKADDVAMVAGKILRYLAGPFFVGGRELFVTASIGVVLYPGDGVEMDSLFKFADSAMYHAKKMGRNNFQFYAREFTVRALERMDTEMALHKALKHEELELYCQPQIDLQTGDVIGAEALLRWHRPGHGLVGPDGFIAIAEESGLILDIGKWVLSSACRAVARWNRGRKEPLRIAVNLSPRQFVRNDLVGEVTRILAETGCEPAWLSLEITENLLLEDCEETRSTLAALDDMGIAIAVDDFGTGYSALNYLHRFPVSHLKIDRSFINGIEDQLDKRELVKAMLLIAAALGLGSVAEGVETFAQADYLWRHGCLAAQGYFFGKTMRIADFEAMLARHEQGRWPGSATWIETEEIGRK